MEFLKQDWCGLAWSAFVPFDADRACFAIIPQRPGVYRVRVAGQNVLAYIGQTGRDLRQRLYGLRLNTLSTQCPFNDPHTAAPKLWSFKDAEGYEYECSAAATEVNESERLALECYLVWQYRLECGCSTLCNFGRLHPSYQTSRNRSTGFRGGRIAGGTSPCFAPSVPPLMLKGIPSERDWMTLEWSDLLPLANGSISAPAEPGVYKLLDGDSLDVLYIGETASLKARLKSHSQSSWGSRRVVMAYCAMPSLTLGCQRLEVECDLIAAYYAHAKQPPEFQFGSRGLAAGGVS